MVQVDVIFCIQFARIVIELSSCIKVFIFVLCNTAFYLLENLSI